jgi:uncharacterized membrane protein
VVVEEAAEMAAVVVIEAVFSLDLADMVLLFAVLLEALLEVIVAVLAIEVHVILSEDKVNKKK